MNPGSQGLLETSCALPSDLFSQTSRSLWTGDVAEDRAALWHTVLGLGPGASTQHVPCPQGLSEHTCKNRRAYTLGRASSVGPGMSFVAVGCDSRACGVGSLWPCGPCHHGGMQGGDSGGPGEQPGFLWKPQVLAVGPSPTSCLGSRGPSAAEPSMGWGWVGDRAAGGHREPERLYWVPDPCVL